MMGTEVRGSEIGVEDLRSRGERAEHRDVVEPSEGTEGNERLTVITGALLVVLLAAVGVTIVFIGRLLWWHLFIGLAVIGPVALKVGSTVYRFGRYYTGEPHYRRKGPPPPALRALGPPLVVLTLLVLATGVALLLIGPSSRGTLLLLHKVSFICWVVLTAIHLVAHLPELARSARVSHRTRQELGELRSLVPGFGGATAPPSPSVPGGGARALALVAAVVLGLVIAAVLIPDFGAWTAAQPTFHHLHFRH